MIEKEKHDKICSIISRQRSSAQALYRLQADMVQVEDQIWKAYNAVCLEHGRLPKYDGATKENILAVSRWLTEGKRPGLLLYGGIGTGKTTMAKAIARVINAYKIVEGWPSVQEMKVTTARQLARLDAEEHREYLNYCQADKLLIDDLGTEPASVKSYGNESFPIVELLCKRYDQRLMTIVTTNLDDQGIAAMYGERVADRFRDMFDRKVYTGKSYRGQ